MMETMNTRPTKPSKYGRRYPWLRWFGQLHFTLKKGRDYDCRTDTMANMVRQAAARHGYKVSILIADDGRSMWVAVLERPNPF